jgi:hypothetical protein
MFAGPLSGFRLQAAAALKSCRGDLLNDVRRGRMCNHRTVWSPQVTVIAARRIAVDSVVLVGRFSEYSSSIVSLLLLQATY